MNAFFMSAPSPLLDAAVSILADGKPRTAEDILAEGRKRGLFDVHTTRTSLYLALSQDVQRALLRGDKPLLLQDPDRRFRLNHPVDDWPDLDATGLPPLAVPSEPSTSATGTIAAVQAAAQRSDSEGFERAVCAAFELFGFSATHVGGIGAPDGYADALLGELGYRVMLECKLSQPDDIARSDAAAEAAKYRDVYNAHYCALVAPSFDYEVTFGSELRTHGVAAWSIDDLVRAATLRLSCWEMRELFAPGYAAAALDDLAWAYVHGSAKRLRVVASLLVEIGLAQQRMAPRLGDAASVPRLTVDVALSLVDDRLTTAGSTNGVTREEIEAAFVWLTSPYVGRAFWSDEGHEAIVIRPAASP